MRRTPLILTALLALVIASPSYAQLEMQHVFPVEHSHSYVKFSLTYMNYAEVRGGFSDFGGTIVYDDGNPQNTSISFRVGVESIDTDNDWRDKDLKSDRWFDAEAYPEISFASSQTQVDGDQLLVTGNLTIRDVTKEITVEVEKPQGIITDMRGDLFITFKGSYTLSRTEFGIIGKHWGGIKEKIVAVGDEVTVHFALLGKQILKKNFSNWLRNPASPQHHIYQAYNDSGMDAAFAQYDLMKDTMDINSGALNIFGYMLIKQDKIDDAIAVLTRNSAEFPDEANVYDSLGEALLRGGQEAEAQEMFEKAVAMDPANTNAREILRHL